MTRRAFLFAVLAVALPAAGCAPTATLPAPESAATTLYLVRHAEKVDNSRDPALSAPGRTRARALATLLGDRPIVAAYASQFRRTQDTARPLADRRGIDVTVLPIEGPDPMATVRGQARMIVANHPGEAVLVVGHSNTIPAMVAELTGDPVINLAENAYEDLFVVTIREGEATVERRRYGAPNPETSE